MLNLRDIIYRRAEFKKDRIYLLEEDMLEVVERLDKLEETLTALLFHLNVQYKKSCIKEI